MISAIDGTAGIGKTALALHWAHQTADRFPDGQLYVNLRGFDPTGTPMHPTDALRGFLDALAIPPQQIPASVDSQAGLYRSLLAERRMLIVLDNARDTEQVRPLLPASPTCVVVITSRSQLSSLVAQHGARPLTLHRLMPQEARTLLTRRLGLDTVNADPEAVTDLITHCAGLPLALAIVAARAGAHRGFALRVLAKELADEHTRLEALDTGDPATSAQSVFSWSYQHLSVPAAQMFRLLGLHPGPDIALPAAAQLADLPPGQARDALRELARAHLLTQPTPGRYTFHDLLRAYAILLTTAHDLEHDQHAALSRLFDHYLHSATAAVNTLHPTDNQPPPDNLLPATSTRPMTDPTTARAWLHAERANLIAVIAHTATHGWYTHTTRLANTVLLRYLEFGLYYLDSLAVYKHVHDAARCADEPATEALALINLGIAHWQQARYLQATESLQQALTTLRELGDRKGEALALATLGLVYWQQSHYQQATALHQQALTISREINFPISETRALSNLGLVHWRQGRYPQATDHYRQAIEICRAIGFPLGEMLSLTHLGLIHWQQGRYPQAIHHHEQALTLAREINALFGEAYTLNNLGLVHGQQGRRQQAIDLHHQALTISRRSGFPAIEVHALNNVGLLLCQQHHYAKAEDLQQQVLTISRGIGLPLGEILALVGLGLVQCGQGRHRQGIGHYQKALTISHEIADRASEPQIRNRLGEAHHANGQADQARTQHAAAHSLATELGDRYEQARAHQGLAHTHHTTGDLEQARHHWDQALTLYTDLEVPDLHAVRAHLAGLDKTSQRIHPNQARDSSPQSQRSMNTNRSGPADRTHSPNRSEA